jgi:uncharacterized membrane protein
LFPVVFSAAAVIPFFLICRELKLRAPSVAIAFSWLAVNGALIKYAQEVRMYALFLGLGLFSTWLFLRFLNLGKNFWLLTAINLLLVYTHYFGWLLVVSEVAAIVILQRIKIRQTAIMFGITLAGFVPWLVAVGQAAENNTGLAQNIGWIGKPNLLTVAEFVFDVIEPFYFQNSTIEPTSIFFVTAPLLLLVITGFAFFAVDWELLDDSVKRNIYLLLIFILVPVGAALLASWILPYSVWGTRHLIVVFGPAAILAATALAEIKLPALRLSLVAAFFCLCAIAFVVQSRRPSPVYIWCAWENLAGRLDVNEPAKIYVFEDLVAYNFWFALRGAESNFEIVKVEGVERMQEDRAYFLPRGFDAVRRVEGNGIEGERFYVAYRDLAFNEKEPPLRQLITRGYRLGPPQVFETTGSKAFLVPVEKIK